MNNIVTQLRMNSECHAPHLMLQAADEIELLRIGVATALKERDEARREVCNIMHKTGFLNGDYADSRGWDCFKRENGK